MPTHTQSSRPRHAAMSLVHQPRRRQDWNGLSAAEILALNPPGKTAPLVVLAILIDLFNKQHTVRHKEVSFKTRQERANFLRRFYRDLKHKAGFATLPDPRNLGQRHIRAMVALWQQEQLAPATIQTYLSFLRALALWLGKPGLVRKPHHYGLQRDDYERHEAADHDRSWSAQHVNIDELIEKIAAYDAHVGAALRLMRALGVRRKEAIMFRPHQCVVPFEATGFSPEKRKAEWYGRIKAGSKGGRERFVALDTPERLAAIDHARQVAATRDAHIGHPALDLKQAMRRFDYVMDKFGITKKQLGVTAHGLRHEVLINQFETLTGAAAPVRGGTKPPAEIDRIARQDVAELAGHGRKRASTAYLGGTAAARGRKA
ncbi:integrase domain-containing protein [Noviherbaspirillum sedimenti]|uniref:Integrase n=1 Tax=Noviherbaspirillum sedimenti TaxID=2320865 RepID=A0A3A3GED4_9BURK|nr:integrase domain-containing protein [Noviherbaspirillum sedimenti]RJG00596.1 integrase [Noviherbaspirillum sedimenti]